MESNETYDHGIDESGDTIVAGDTQLGQVEGSLLLLH